jgi:hypothetical protein
MQSEKAWTLTGIPSVSPNNMSEIFLVVVFHPNFNLYVFKSLEFRLAFHKITLIRHLNFFVFGLLKDAVSSSDYIASNGTKINERWIGKHAARLFQCVRLEGLRNPRKAFGTISVVPAEIGTGHLLDICQKNYRLGQLARYEAYSTKLSTAYTVL